MRSPSSFAMLLVALPVACTRPSPAPSPPQPPAGTSFPVPEEPSPVASASASAAPAAPQLEPDGDDDPSDTGSAPLPEALRFERIGRAPLALQRICDLTPLGDALYASHANQPLGTDGATITRYRPDDDKHPFTVAFDWNRPGEPTKGGGGGQGFLRVHDIGGRLFVPDTDPPYAGFGLVDPATEGYVFVSDASGAFAPARMPGHRPPPTPTPGPDGHAGAGVLPRAYHVIDVIRFRGRLYASTGSVPPTERAWRGASPGALHVADDAWSRWTYETDYPFPWQAGVWRLTYLVRFRDKLYAGIQDYDGHEPNDYVVFSPPVDTNAHVLAHEDAHAIRVTSRGAALTLRWYADAGKLWWIASDRGEGVVLRVTDDGARWTAVPLPASAGWPTDITRYRGAVVVLTERGLWRVDVDPPVELASLDTSLKANLKANLKPTATRFPVDDGFCAAPLAVFRGDLYAGDQRDGSLWRIAPPP